MGAEGQDRGCGEFNKIVGDLNIGYRKRVGRSKHGNGIIGGVVSDAVALDSLVEDDEDLVIGGSYCGIGRTGFYQFDREVIGEVFYARNGTL